MGTTSFCQKERRNQNIKYTSLGCMFLAWLMSLTQQRLLFVWTTQRVLGRARNASPGFGPPEFWHLKKGKEQWVCGVRNVSSDSSLQLPEPSSCILPHRQENVATDNSGRGALKQRRKSGHMFPGTLGILELFEGLSDKFSFDRKYWFTGQRVLVRHWLNTQHPAPPSTAPKPRISCFVSTFLSGFLNLATFKKSTLRELIFT